MGDSAVTATRVAIQEVVFADYFAQAQPDWIHYGQWPAHWVGAAESTPALPYVMAFRLRFTVEQAETIRIHVSADERYTLYLDGQRIGRGPERGDGRNWHFESYDLALAAGDHLLVARVTALGEHAPMAQHSLRPGFLLCPDDKRFWDVLATGCAAWQVRRLEGYRFIRAMAAMFAGSRTILDGEQFPWGYESGKDDEAGWMPSRKLHPAYADRRNECLPAEHLLTPAALPPMLDEVRHIGQLRHLSAPALSQTHSIPIRAVDHLADEAPAWEGLLRGDRKVIIPPNTRRRALIDLNDYYCAYPELIVSWGDQASIRIHWQEALFDKSGVSSGSTWDRGHRGQIEGKYFTTMWHDVDGEGDTYLLRGKGMRHLEPLWWQAGRYVEIVVETGNEMLLIERLTFNETRYPLSLNATFEADDTRLPGVFPIGFRAVQMCAHDTYMDCPYYEQLQYIGDTRLQALVTFLCSGDDRLARQALRTFDASRLPNGLTQSRYPSRQRQIIPPFSLWWVAMLHDFLMWRGDPAFVVSMLPGARGVLDHFSALRGADKLVRSPDGWNFTDWVPDWSWGIPPGGDPGQTSVAINWHYVYTLYLAADLERRCGEPEIAARWDRLARETADALIACYWDADRGLFADDTAHTSFSEHSQCLAVLSGYLPDAQRDNIAGALFGARFAEQTPTLTTPTVYFLHYYFETCRALGRIDKLFERLGFWYQMRDFDFKTTYENGDPHTNRSDCHAWGAHPLYHAYSSILGLRPTQPGCAVVEIAPQLGALKQVSGRLMHPAGEIVFSLAVNDGQNDGQISGQIVLPVGVNGAFRWADQRLALHEGMQEIVCP